MRTTKEQLEQLERDVKDIRRRLQKLEGWRSWHERAVPMDMMDLRHRIDELYKALGKKEKRLI